MTEETELTVLNIKEPDEAPFRSSEKMLEIAHDRKITTPKSAVAAGEDLKKIKALTKEVEESRTSITKPINKALREINARFKPAKDWLAEAERILKSKLLEYQAEQDRIAQEAQRKADEETRKEREKLELKAKLAQTIGMSEKADELREEAETQIAPVIKSAAPQVSGVVRRETWKAEVTDKMAFLKHVVEARPDLLPLISIDQSALNAQARSLKDGLDLPGVKTMKEASIAARGS